MKRLLSQNAIEISYPQKFKIFECINCGCKFESDEYIKSFTEVDDVKIVYFIDNCFTCKKLCILFDYSNNNL